MYTHPIFLFVLAVRKLRAKFDIQIQQPFGLVYLLHSFVCLLKFSWERIVHKEIQEIK